MKSDILKGTNICHQGVQLQEYVIINITCGCVKMQKMCEILHIFINLQHEDDDDCFKSGNQLFSVVLLQFYTQINIRK